jgi:hypothetical protein
MDWWIRAFLLKKQAHVLLVEEGGGLYRYKRKVKCKDFCMAWCIRKTWSFITVDGVDAWDLRFFQDRPAGLLGPTRVLPSYMYRYILVAYKFHFNSFFDKNLRGPATEWFWLPFCAVADIAISIVACIFILRP